MEYTVKELKLISDCLIDSLILKNRQLEHDPRYAWYLQPQIEKITKLLAKTDKTIVSEA